MLSKTVTAEKAEGEEDEKELVARRMEHLVQVNGALLCTASIAHIAITLMYSVLSWEQPPAWLSRVPCILQSRLESLTNVSSTISRFMQATDLVPAVAVLVLLGNFFFGRPRSQEMTPWLPPSSLALAAIWVWKILIPVLVYMCVHAKSDHVVNYDAVSRQMCEVAVMLSLYPPTPLATLNSTWVNVRTAAALYFRHERNWKYPAFRFESELAGLELLATPVGASDNKGVPLHCSSVTSSQHHDFEYWHLYAHMLPNNATTRFCNGAVAAGKDMGLDGLAAALFALNTFADHVTNILSGLGFAYTFCDAKQALGGKPLFSPPLPPLPAFPPDSPTLLQICSEWGKGHRNTSSFPKGYIEYLNPAGTWELEEKLGRTSASLVAAATFAKRALSVDLDGIDATKEGVTLIACVLNGAVDPGTNAPAMPALMCPNIIDSLKASIPQCRFAKALAHPPTMLQCQQQAANRDLSAHAVDLARLPLWQVRHDRPSLRRQRDWELRKILPTNFTSLSLLLTRIASALHDGAVLSSSSASSASSSSSSSSSAGEASQFLHRCSSVATCDEERLQHAKYSWVRLYATKEARGGTALSSRYLQTLLASEGETQREELGRRISAGVQRSIDGLKAYLFRMLPRSSRQDAISLGTCDLQMLASCAKEMRESNVCKCIDNEVDLHDHVGFALSAAPRDGFQGIGFWPLDRTAEDARTILDDWVRDLKGAVEVDGIVGVLEAGRQYAGGLPAVMASAAFQLSHLISLVGGFEAAVKLGILSLAALTGGLQGLNNYFAVLFHSLHSVTTEANDERLTSVLYIGPMGLRSPGKCFFFNVFIWKFLRTAHYILLRSLFV
jgi:hypothetical protein